MLKVGILLRPPRDQLSDMPELNLDGHQYQIGIPLKILFLYKKHIKGVNNPMPREFRDRQGFPDQLLQQLPGVLGGLVEHAVVEGLDGEGWEW
jgi:hypothetical protein